MASTTTTPAKKPAVTTAGGSSTKPAVSAPGKPAPEKVPAPAPAAATAAATTNSAGSKSSGGTSSSSPSRPPTPPVVKFGPGPTLFRKFDLSLLRTPGSDQVKTLAQRPARLSTRAEELKKK